MFLLGAALSPNGGLLAVGGQPREGSADGRQIGVVRTWDLETGNEHRAWQVGGLASGVDFSPDGRFVAAVHTRASVWNVETGDAVVVIAQAASSSADRIRFSPDGKTLALGAYRRVQLFDISALAKESKPPD